MSTAIAISSCHIPVLIASSDPELRRQTKLHFDSAEWNIQEALGGADALGKLEDRRCKLLLLDRALPDLRTDELVGIVEARFPGTDVILIDPETGVPQIPADLLDDRMYRTLRKSWEGRTSSQPDTVNDDQPVQPLPGMIGKSNPMLSLYGNVRLVARRNTPVLITGENGTGKELIARSIHQLSSRSAAPLITVNCAAIPETLFEAELFGHARGAFTGAVQSRIGKIQAAQGGTLFLDEIGELAPGSQAKLLRFLENGEVQRLGSSDVFRVDVRVVAATNASLKARIGERSFREDLYYRLAVFPICAPPLRDRASDVLILARHFLTGFSGSSARFEKDAESLLESHSWPGNVRELQHVVERAAILSDGGRTIRREHIQIIGREAEECGE